MMMTRLLVITLMALIIIIIRVHPDRYQWLRHAHPPSARACAVVVRAARFGVLRPGRAEAGAT